VQVEIEDRNDDGRGRGRVGRRVALVSQAHPGERVTMRVDRHTGGTLQGRVARLLRADPGRVPTTCAHAFHCTGCVLLQATLADEERFKAGRVAGAVATVSGPSPEPTLRGEGLFGYRHLAKQVFARREGKTILGSYVAGTHRVTDNEGCPILAEPLRDVLRSVVEVARELDAAVDDRRRDTPGLRYAVARLSRAKGHVLLTIATSEGRGGDGEALARRVFEESAVVSGAHLLVNDDPGNAVLAGALHHVAGDRFVSERVAGHDHQIGPRTFFQVNPAAAERLFAVALECAGSGARCLEGYAGVGALTLPLADRFQHVVAVESNPEAVGVLRDASQRAAVEVRQGDAAQLIPVLLAAASWDAVVLDPPRRGLDAEVTAALARCDAPRIVLLSCDPGTLTRDLPALTAAGYQVRRVVPVDQFPRTAHVETVTLLDR